MSNWLIKFLLVQYIVIAMVCVYEHNWARVLYWIGAGILNYSILLGMRRYVAGRGGDNDESLDIYWNRNSPGVVNRNLSDSMQDL